MTPSTAFGELSCHYFARAHCELLILEKRLLDRECGQLVNLLTAVEARSCQHSQMRTPKHILDAKDMELGLQVTDLKDLEVVEAY